MRKTYEIDGMTFQMRTFTGRDISRATGKLPLLPMPDPVAGASKVTMKDVAKFADIGDAVLALCSRNPKITLDEPDEIPEGTIPVSEIPDKVYGELIRRLSEDSGWTTEAANEVRPTSGTDAGSAS